MKVEKKQKEFDVVITLSGEEAKELKERMGKVSSPTGSIHFELYSRLDNLLGEK